MKILDNWVFILSVSKLVLVKALFCKAFGILLNYRLIVQVCDPESFLSGQAQQQPIVVTKPGTKKYLL